MWLAQISAARLGLIAVGALALGIGGAFYYESFVRPANDINRLGVPEIRPWSSRNVVRNTWLGGSSTLYVYPVTFDTERRLRTLCEKSRTAGEPVGAGMCTFALERPTDSGIVEAKVGDRTVFLEYNSGT